MDIHKKTYRISEVRPYINWGYFFYAWMLHKPEQQAKIRGEAESLLDKWEDTYRTHTLFAIGDAYSQGDDIFIEGTRLPMLRQQAIAEGRPSLSMADFIKPRRLGIDRMGLFATTVDIGLETDFSSDDYMKMMAQLIADRLAEATAERMHEEVRKHYWGYAKDEHLTMDELHLEKFQGTRPAVGYPSLPDASLNFLLSDILHFSDIGIRLTESGAMKPHASVSGLMIAHPKAHYFSIGKIDEVQLRDYARRRGIPEGIARKFLAGNLSFNS